MNNLHRIDRADWPELINNLAGIIGDESAMIMFSKFAGRHLHIPKSFSNDKLIESVIGAEKAKQLYDVYSGEQLNFPNGKLILIKMRNRQIKKEWAEGMSQCDIATKHNLCERHISGIINGNK
jgi:Mor family transcriptional regulator